MYVIVLTSTFVRYAIVHVIAWLLYYISNDRFIYRVIHSKGMETKQTESKTLGYSSESPTFEGRPVNPKILAIERKIIELSRLCREVYSEHMIEEQFPNDVLNLNSELFKQYKNKREWGLVD